MTELDEEIKKAFEENQSSIREMGAVTTKTLLDSAEKLLAEQKLEPLTKREKVLLLSVAASITMQAATVTLAALVADGQDP